MKRLIAALILLFIMPWPGNATAADAGGAIDLPDYSVDYPQMQSELFSLKARVNQLEADFRNFKDNRDKREAVGLVLILFGTVCALWAQNTGRNPWVWFFAGVFFNIFTALAVLKQNSKDREQNVPE